MSARAGRLLFIAGIAVFLLAKLYLVVPTTAALAVPRLGDDALVYLWKGKLAYTENAEQLPALRDIAMQRHLQDDASEELRWMRSNVAQRTIGLLTPSYAALTAAALAVAPDLRWAFAMTEVVGIVMMAIGMAWFLAELGGAAVAGLGLLSMAFAVLPNQGIYAFIPSTLTLSCSLILWAYLWRRGEDASAAGTGLAALLILGLHPIAKVYVALTPVLYWLRLGGGAAWRARPLWRIALACSLPILLALALPWLIPALRPPPSEIMGGLDVLGGAMRNFDAILGLAWDPILRNNLPWALMLSGTVFFAPRLLLAWPFGGLIAGLVALLGVSLAFWLPGYPGELFSRLWVLFVLLTAAVGARFMLEQWAGTGLRQRLFKWAFSVLVVLSALVWVFKYVPAVMNWRNEVLVEDVLRQELVSIPADTTLLYAETTVALQAALLLGGERLGALAYPMLKGTGSLDRLIAARRPAFIVAPSDTRLNSLAEAGAKRFTPRRQGLYFPVVREFVLNRNGGLPLSGLWLRLESREAAPTMISWLALDGNGKQLARGSLETGSGTVRLGLPSATETLRFELPDAPVWLTGAGAGEASGRVLWPWGAGWRLDYTLRHKVKPPLSIEFSPAALLARFGAEELARHVDPVAPVLSDAGGLVFLRTRYTTPPVSHALDR